MVARPKRKRSSVGSSSIRFTVASMMARELSAETTSPAFI